MLHGSTAEEKKQYSLAASPQAYAYTKGTEVAPGIDDVAEWIVTEGEKVHCSRISRLVVGLYRCLSDFISIPHCLCPDSCYCQQRCHGTEEIREEKCRRRR